MRQDPDVRLCQLCGIFRTTLPDMASALLNGQATNGKRSTVKMLPGSVLLCPGPVPGLLGWDYPEQLGLSSTASGLVLGDSIRPCTNETHKWGLAPSPNCECGFWANRRPCTNSVADIIGHHMEHEVWRLWMTKLDAGLIIQLPASDSGSSAVWGSKRINPRPQCCLFLTWSGYPSNDDNDYHGSCLGFDILNRLARCLV